MSVALPETTGAFPSSPSATWPGRSRALGGLAAAILVACCLPLFLGLDRQDIENDESIYTYAALRMAETGDWLTPRYVDTDGLFLEKPPLKFWLAAVPVRLGLIPGTVAGLRLIDAALSAAAFGYLMLFGWRLAGIVCGAVTLILLLSYHSLLFHHGLRENNMESALVLSYAAGLFHVVAWASSGTAVARRRHAMAAALWFVLGFMTKFVAALFLPMVAGAALIVTPAGRDVVRRQWRDWIVPALTALGLITPWFVYQLLTHPDEFWSTIFGAHVYMRFTTFVDPAHVQPWHFYLTDTWARLRSDVPGVRVLQSVDAARVLVVGGILYGLWRLRGSGQGMAALLLLWWALPVGLISLGTSKVTHYAYPFLPGLALAAGWLCADALGAVERRAGGRVQAWRARVQVWQPALGSWPRRLLMVLAVAGIVLAAVTFVNGPLTLAAGDIRLFRNSSIVRPVLVAVLLLAWLGHGRAAVRVAAATFLVLLLPLETAARTVERALTVHHPLRSARECLLNLAQTDPGLRRGIYRSDPYYPYLGVHQLYYSLRDTGAWVEGMERYDAELRTRLTDPARQTPLLLSAAQWEAARGLPMVQDEGTATAVRVLPGVVLVLPGPYRACAAEIQAAGGRLAEAAPTP
ncbi:MAG: hypothetical protein IT177_21665 [Acidobacteria bacterium]|nr:hypothetical protein [Acidobacteriota bacterium]